MHNLLPLAWYLSLIVITGYYLFIFRARKSKPIAQRESPPGVSVVIAVKNGSQIMRDNLHSLLRQDYPKYEIIIVDDYSEPKELHELELLVDRLPDVFLFRSDRAPGKKHALSMGIEKSNHEIILCTDADCQPASPSWIKKMIDNTSGKEMVLGYAPYYLKAGRLNQFIRFETVMTGIQYLSWCGLGKPYMGVGRNLLFPKAAFIQSDPYAKSKAVPYGDDDLLVQAIRNEIPARVSLHPNTFVYSETADSWRGWFRQKHRHLSAGRFYSLTAWLQPGIFGLGVIFHWLLLIPMLWFHVSVVFDLAFFGGILIRWFGYASWTKRLGEEDTKWFYPSYELLYALYLVVLGSTTILTRKEKWN